MLVPTVELSIKSKWENRRLQIYGLLLCTLRFAEDIVVTKSSPSYGWKLISVIVGDRYPLPGCSTVGPAEAPSHLENTWRIYDRFHSQTGGPRGRIFGFDEVIASHIKGVNC